MATLNFWTKVYDLDKREFVNVGMEIDIMPDEYETIKRVMQRAHDAKLTGLRSDDESSLETPLADREKFGYSLNAVLYDDSDAVAGITDL